MWLCISLNVPNRCNPDPLLETASLLFDGVLVDAEFVAWGLEKADLGEEKLLGRLCGVLDP
jgi:hypothetical protein